jgi:hypothetical protein
MQEAFVGRILAFFSFIAFVSSLQFSTLDELLNK